MSSDGSGLFGVHGHVIGNILLMSKAFIVQTTRSVVLIGAMGFFVSACSDEDSLTNRTVSPAAASQKVFCGRDHEPAPVLVSLDTLLANPDQFHLHHVTVRGRITQPELHIDETELFLDFVFLLEEEGKRLLVFGRFDRTQGNNPIVTDAMVEVTGIFWKERLTEQHRFRNNLEACRVAPYPSLVPDAV